MSERLLAFWAQRGRAILLLATVLLVIAAAVYLPYKFLQLTTGTERLDAIDLLARHRETREFFDRIPIYRVRPAALYPPASYVMFWPFMGWTESEAVVRWLWAATSALGLAVLVVLTIKVSGTTSRAERLFLGALPLGMYATGGTIGNGQLALHVLPALVAMPPLLAHARTASSFGGDLLLAVLFVLASIKPHLAAPFVFLLLFVPGRVRPTLLVAVMYSALTVYSAEFQNAPLHHNLLRWFRRLGDRNIASKAGFGSINDLLLRFEAYHLGVILPIATLILFAAWIWWNRKRSPWLLAGAAAIVARVGSYHAWYDDLLLLIPMIALFRLAKGVEGDGAPDPVAGLFLALLAATMIAPGGHYLLPEPVRSVYTTAVVALWLIVLAFIVKRVHETARSDGPVIVRFETG